MTTVKCDLDILTPQGRMLAQATSMDLQHALDQIPGWMEQGLTVNLRVHKDTIESASAALYQSQDDLPAYEPVESAL